MLEDIDRHFSLTTLRRLLDSRDVRKKIGIDVISNVIRSGLPAEELIKPLRHFVTEIAKRKLTSRDLHTVQNQVDYVDALPKNARANLSKIGTIRDIADIAPTNTTTRRGKAKSKTPPVKPTDRPCLIPKNASLNIGDAKIGAIGSELKRLKVDTFPHAISVLFRVFLELTTDYYMAAKGISTIATSRRGHPVDKNLATKVQDVIDDLVHGGARKKDFAGIQRALQDKRSPLSIELLNGYVHNRFIIPKSHDLLGSWDESRPYFETIWA